MAKVIANKKCLVCTSNGWKVVRGQHPVKQKGSASDPLFEVVGEKLPLQMLEKVRKNLRELLGRDIEGVYVAHDSVGVARYVGRGKIFVRLSGHYRRHKEELKYFSFYVLRDKAHERAIETLCIRVAGPQVLFNTRKKREDIRAGNVRDWPAGTVFYQRQYARGKRKGSQDE